MPVSVVVGGQFGSEGKGKVALHRANDLAASAVVRVGGPNSGHTGIDRDGREWILRQLPASCLDNDALIVLPAGSLIDPELLRVEVEALKICPKRLLIDRKASVVLEAHRQKERECGLVEAIGSTSSGTGASLAERIGRGSGHRLAAADEYLQQFAVDSASEVLRTMLDRKERIVVEGTQGFGLSIWHGGSYPFATSRDTTAAAFVSEAGLAPHDVDDVVMVVRAFPIRVGGNSGPLPDEISWRDLASEAGLEPNFHETTSATKRIRRIARFDPHIVKAAIRVNAPHRIVLNHLDYIGHWDGGSTERARLKEFIETIETKIGRRVDLLGFSKNSLIERARLHED